MQAINRPTRETALLFINAWADTRQIRPTESKAYGSERRAADFRRVIDALRNYDIRPVSWTQRIDIVTELAA